MKAWLYVGIGLACCLPGATLAQLDLSGFYTQTVKTGQPWASINTGFQHLDLRIEVNRGVVTTRATFEYTPGQGFTSEYRCAPVQDSCLKNQVSVPENCSYSQCGYVNVAYQALDSLETSAYFQLEDNSVLTDMYLWVGETKVKAALQERALASAQYESIVQRRKDPALIESWGGGSYNLRIFPNESGKARKLQIEFVQGLENEGSRLLTRLPVSQTLAQMNVPYTGQVGNQDTVPYRILGQVDLEIVSVDGKTYDLDWPGIGSGMVGGTPLKLSAKNVKEIKPGSLSIAAAGCATCLTPWVAEKSGAGYFGVKALLNSKNLRFGGQPTERHFILDIHGSTQDSLEVERARKLALLSLKAYGAAPHVANLGFSNGKGGISYAFAKPVSMDGAQLQKAYLALRAWRPSTHADAPAAIRALAAARANVLDTVLLCLINNDTTPYFNWQGIWSEASQARYDAFEKAQSKQDSALARELKAAKMMLFGFWNNYRLGTVALQTGGFQIGSLYGYYYYTPVASVSDGAAVMDPFANLQLPPLFGPGRPDAYGLVDLKVDVQGHAIQGLTILQQPAYSYYYRSGGIMVDAAVAKSAMSIAPYGAGSPDSIPLRLAGQYQGAGRVTVKISALWGGLPFAGEYAVDLPAFADGNVLGAGIWALQQSESLGRDYSGDHLSAIQQVGKDYHIVNRQMSLLALEPGMDLWAEMPSKSAGASSETGVANDQRVSLTSGKYASNGGAIDNVTLEAILDGFAPIRIGPVSGKSVLPVLSARSLGDQVDLKWTLSGQADKAEFRIVSLNGQVVATLTGQRRGEGFLTTWKAPKQQGIFVVMAKAGRVTQTQSVVLGMGTR